MCAKMDGGRADGVCDSGTKIGCIINDYSSSHGVLSEDWFPTCELSDSVKSDTCHHSTGDY